MGCRILFASYEQDRGYCTDTVDSEIALENVFMIRPIKIT